jgi:hypothetical protein
LLFEEGIKYYEDLHMVWRLIAYSDVIVELTKNYNFNKKNKGSAMYKFNKERIGGFY